MTQINSDLYRIRALGGREASIGQAHMLEI